MHWPGNGSDNAPYIIEGYNIVPMGEMDGISIQNVTFYFIIKDVLVSYAYVPSKNVITAGIRLNNVSNVIIENFTSQSNKIGIYIANSSNISVTSCEFLNGDMGIYLYNSTHTRFYFDNFSVVNKNSIYIYSSKDVVVEHNKFLNVGVGVFGKYSKEIKIEKNYFEKGEAFSAVWYSQNVNVENNTAYDYKDVSIVSRISDYVKIFGNKLARRGKRPIDELAHSGMWLYSSNFTPVKDNEIVGNYTQWHGIWAQDSKNLTIENNSIISQMSYGIVTVRISNCIVEKNILSHNKGAGIWMVDMRFAMIKENKITYNFKKGYLGSLRGYGILMDDSQRNIIKENLFAFNGIGIYVKSGRNNLIYNNSFYYNDGSGDSYNPKHIQAWDECTIDHWNTSKYGNYWQDWAFMNDSNGDGIIDEPYLLDSYNHKKIRLSSAKISAEAL